MLLECRQRLGDGRFEQRYFLDIARRRTFNEFTYSIGLIIVYKLQFNHSQIMSENYLTPWVVFEKLNNNPISATILSPLFSFHTSIETDRLPSILTLSWPLTYWFISGKRPKVHYGLQGHMGSCQNHWILMAKVDQ